MLLRWLTTSVVLILTGACKPHRFVYSPSEIGYVIVDPNDDIHIRSLEVLTGVGELGVPRQRAMAMAVADYGPIKEHKITMGAGIDSLCTKEGGVDAATTAINDPRVLGIIGTTCSLSAVDWRGKMPAKRYRVRLTAEERKELDPQVNTGTGSARRLRRAPSCKFR